MNELGKPLRFVIGLSSDQFCEVAAALVWSDLAKEVWSLVKGPVHERVDQRFRWLVLSTLYPFRDSRQYPNQGAMAPEGEQDEDV